MAISQTSASKSTLKLVKGSKPLADQPIRRWVKAPADMPADRYKAVVESAAKVTKYGRPTAELQFTVVDGDYAGVCLAGWITIELIGRKRLKPGSAYERCCEIALETDDLPDDLSPTLFVGKVFTVEATYAKTSGKSRARLDETANKGEWDKLRVVKLVALSDL
jgi:hypothetical protein